MKVKELIEKLTRDDVREAFDGLGMDVVTNDQLELLRKEIPANIIISCAPANLRELLECLSKAEPIMMTPSGDFPAYIVDADKVDRARDLAKQMLEDFNRINNSEGRK